MHAQGARNGESSAANRLPQAFEHKRVAPAHRRTEESGEQKNLARTDNPTDQAQRKAGRDGSVATVGGLHGKINSLRLCDPLRPIPFARKSPYRAH